MTNSVTPFLFEIDEETGIIPVRVVVIDGAPWWIAKDACEALGITNPRMAVERIDGDCVSQADVTDSLGRVRSTNVVNEPGLYELIFRSDKRRAVKFRRWVFQEVLPSVRREGGYIRPNASVQQLEDLALKATTLAEAQTRMLKAAEGIVDSKWLEAKTRHVLARGLGEEPEVAPADRPLTVGEYLEEKGVGGAALRTTSPAFGKAVKAEYRARHGRDPMPVERFVSGALRAVAGYTETDRPIFDAVWARTRAVIE